MPEPPPLLRLLYERMCAFQDEDSEGWDLDDLSLRRPVPTVPSAAQAALLAALKADGVDVDAVVPALPDGADGKRALGEALLEEVWREGALPEELGTGLRWLLRAALLEAEDVERVEALVAAPSEPSLLSLLASAPFFSPLALQTILTLLHLKAAKPEAFAKAADWLKEAAEEGGEVEADEELGSLLAELGAKVTAVVAGRERMAALAMEEARDVQEALSKAEASLRSVQADVEAMQKARQRRCPAKRLLKSQARGEEGLGSVEEEDEVTLVADAPRLYGERKPVVGDKVWLRIPGLERRPGLCERAKVLAVHPEDQFTVATEGEGGGEQKAHAWDLALASGAGLSELCFAVGVRVVAPMRPALEDAQDPDLPPDHYLATVIENPEAQNGRRIAVLFDNNTARYFSPLELRPVAASHPKPTLNWRFVPADATHKSLRSFLRWFLARYPLRMLIADQALLGPAGAPASVERDGDWFTGERSARIVRHDANIALVKFPGDLPDYQWLYKGSDRFYCVHRQRMKAQEKGEADEEVKFGSPVKRRAVRKTPVDKEYLQQEQQRRIRQEHTIFENSQTARRTGDPAAASRADVDSESSDDEDSALRQGLGPDLHSVSAQGPVAISTEEPFELVELPEDAPRTAEFQPHECTAACLPPEVEPKAKMLFEAAVAKGEPPSPFLEPLLAGWSRLVGHSAGGERRRQGRKAPKRSQAFYRAPCGRALRDVQEVAEYLRKVRSRLPINAFFFEADMDPLVRYREPPRNIKYYQQDYSHSAEETPISAVNAVEDAQPPPLDDYQPTRFPYNTAVVEDDFDIHKVCSGCTCTDDCAVAERCECRQLTAESALSILKEGESLDKPEYGYDGRRLTKPVPAGIYECGVQCPCSKAACPNRVVQLPMNIPLQLFKTKLKGWGVRTLVDVPVGSFVCIYAGAILSDDTAEALGSAEGDEYFADLDLIRTIEATKFGRDDERDKSTEEVEAAAKKPRLDPATGQPSTIVSFTDHYGTDRVFVIDARKFGNIGRYLNHSCEPNVFVQNVLVDTHDMRFPWVAFFATRGLKAGEEICWDYAYEVDSVPGRQIICQCGTRGCRGRLL